MSAVVLAAGTSSRLGRPKQLLLLGGIPVLRRVVDAAISSPAAEVVVVLGHAAQESAASIRSLERTRTVVNPAFAEGQSTSLRAGLRACRPDAAAAVILLGDQPGIHPEAIAAVIQTWRDTGTAAVQAAYGGKMSHPTLFDRSVWPALEEVTGDEGARAVLRRHPEWVATVDVGGDPPEDIDTEADYERIRRRFEGP